MLVAHIIAGISKWSELNSAKKTLAPMEMSRVARARWSNRSDARLPAWLFSVLQFQPAVI